MKEPWVRPNLVIHKLLETHMDEVRAEMVRQVMERPLQRASRPTSKSPRRYSTGESRWSTATYSTRFAPTTRESSSTTARILPSKRHAEGFPALEVCNAIRLLQTNILNIVGGDPQATHMRTKLQNLLDMTVEFGCDQIIETYEELGDEVPDDATC